MKKLILMFVCLLLSVKIFSQFQTEQLSFSGTEDLVMNLGKYRIGTAIDIKLEVEGGWAEGGGIYHIAGDWNQLPKVLYRSEGSISRRIKFYGYVYGMAFVYLFATWDNVSPGNQYPNIVRFTIQSSGYFDKNDQGTFNNAVELRNVLSIQANNESVGIGTICPAYPLDVMGTIRAREVKVDLQGGCDFVFKNDYNLIDLKELEQFVKVNQHLPEIAPEKEMIENGVNMKEMQLKLLQKIEELTLYTIEQNKSLDELKQVVKLQSEEIDKLKTVIKKE